MSVIEEKSQRLRADIIKHLYYKKLLSLTDLSKFTNKSIPLITSAVNGLIEEGYILEYGLAPSTGGRRASTYFLNPNHKKYIVAVAMDQLITRLTIYDLSRNSVIETQSIDFDLSDQKNGAEHLARFIKAEIDASGLAKKDILGVGIGMPGFVNAEKGINDSYLSTSDRSTLRDFLKKQVGLPVYIDNDSSLIALAELHFCEAQGLKDVMVVNIGWGTGLGMIINGGLYRGSNGYAGEFSHMPLSSNNNLCSCGKRGCLEVDTSLVVMVEKAKKAIANGDGAVSSMQGLFKDKSKHPGDHFLDAVLLGDPVALSILYDAAFQIGKGLSTLIHILNPEMIVLSGRGSKAGKLLMPSIQQAINEFCIPRIAEQTTIKLSGLVNDAEFLAAASLMVENSQF